MEQLELQRESRMVGLIELVKIQVKNYLLEKKKIKENKSGNVIWRCFINYKKRKSQQKAIIIAKYFIQFKQIKRQESVKIITNCWKNYLNRKKSRIDAVSVISKA